MALQDIDKSDEKKRYTVHLTSEDTVISSREESEKKKSDVFWFYLGSYGQLGLGVAAPLLLGALIGKYVDAKFLTYPRATVGGLFAGLVLSLGYFIHTVLLLVKKK